MKKLIPLNDQVVLKPLDQSQQKIGNIIIPDVGNEKPILAEVIALGESMYNWRSDMSISVGNVLGGLLSPGDIVAIPKMGATVISIEGQDYYVCQSSQLLVKIIEVE